MSQENVKLVRQGYEALAKGDVEQVFARYDPEIVFDVSRRLVDPDVSYGLEGLRKFIAGSQAAWSVARVEAENFIDAGDSVIVTVRSFNTGRASGIETVGRVSWVWESRDGLAVRATMYQREADAVEVVGLRE